MNLKKLKNQNGETRWEVCFRTAGKCSSRIRRRFETRPEAEAFMIDFKSRKKELKRSGNDAPDFEETTFRKEAEYWALIQKDRVSPGYYKRILGVFAELFPKYGNLSPKLFHPGFLTNIQSEQLAKHLTPTTVNRKLEIIRAILNFSERQRRIPNNPTRGYRKLKEVREEISHWERHEAEDFLRFASRKYFIAHPKRWIYAVYLLAINAGPRAGEIWGLQPRDIVQDGELIHIQRQLDNVIRDFRTTKGKTSRRIPCNPVLKEELLRIIEIDRLKSDQTIFRRADGQPIIHKTFQEIFEKDLKEWGGTKIRFHDLRHTAISLMIANGLDLKTVQDIAGHKDIKTTMGYAHLLGERIKHAARTFIVQPSPEEPIENAKPFLRLVK